MMMKISQKFVYSPFKNETASKTDLNEDQLASQLKEFCDEDGNEINPQSSAPILHQLAKLYQQRDPTDQLSLIKSAALFNAAMVRSPGHAEMEIEEDLQKLCKHILNAANAKEKDVNLVEKAENFKEEIMALRSKVSFKLSQIKPIPDEHPNLFELQMEKMFAITHLQNQITYDYKRIMVNIATLSEEILGSAPCNFAMAGVGSLARKEITPFSDFQYIIVLEQQKQWRNSLPYFRWFNVLFQVFLVNLQETALSKLNIFALNDKSSKHGNWFRDSFTTDGVSFDGLMLHCCSFPLRKLLPFDMDSITSELVKPAEEMVEYLNAEEKLKDGYALQGVQPEVCFVHKDKKIYQQFVEQLRDQQLKNSVERRRQATQAGINFLAECATLFPLNNLRSANATINLDQLLYYGSAGLFMIFGAIYNIYAPSIFDMLTTLGKNAFVQEHQQRDLMNLVALSCEIRLRWYMHKYKQCGIVDKSAKLSVVIASLSDIIGISETTRFFEIASQFQRDLAGLLRFQQHPCYSNFKCSDCNMWQYFSDRANLRAFVRFFSNNAELNLELQHLKILHKLNKSKRNQTLETKPKHQNEKANSFEATTTANDNPSCSSDPATLESSTK